MQDTAVMTYTDEASGTEFQWHGGEYIEIGYTATEATGPFNDQGQASYDAGDFVAGEVINVWDHAADKPTIDRNLQAFEERCRDWLSDNDEDE